MKLFLLLAKLILGKGWLIMSVDISELQRVVPTDDVTDVTDGI